MANGFIQLIMENFYRVKFSTKKDQVFIESTLDYPSDLLSSGEYIPEAGIKAMKSEGSKYYDIVRFQDVFNFAISEHFFHLLLNHNITGWKSYDVEILNENRKYYGFQTIGVGGPLIKPSQKGPVIGYDFDKGKWDGSDFFYLDESRLLLCTRKTRDLIISNSISNIELEHISKVQWINI